MFPKFMPIFLFVSHITAGGNVVDAPPADMNSLTECAIEKKRVEKGFRVDAVEEFQVDCLVGPDAFRRMEEIRKAQGVDSSG